MLKRCAVNQEDFKDTAIPIADSINHVRADMRRRRYLIAPQSSVTYLTGVAGEFLHPDFVNVDILARAN